MTDKPAPVVFSEIILETTSLEMEKSHFDAIRIYIWFSSIHRFHILQIFRQAQIHIPGYSLTDPGPHK